MTHKHVLDASLLREYDIRGIVGSTLFDADAYAIGQAFGTIVLQKGGKSVAVGRDGRHSSASMETSLISGLISTGLTVFQIGLCPTPELYFAVHHLRTEGGIMVTGSHNPPEYNGFKFMIGIDPFFGQDIQNIGDISKTGSFLIGSGGKIEINVSNSYITRLLTGLNTGRPLSIIWDCGNGSAGPAVSMLCRKLPGKHNILYSEVDGDFPNHHPDPTIAENLEILSKTVIREDADIGIALDGDGDRIGVVDNNGAIVWGDQLLAILAEDVLKENPNATIIADVKASQIVFDHIKSLGGKPLMWRTGHSLIKQKMTETGAQLAGEMSGHIFFKDRYYGYDDALYAGIRLIELLSHRPTHLSSLCNNLPKMVNTPELRFPCAESRKFSAVEDLKLIIEQRDDIQVSNIDGIRVSSKYGWWLLRASNTQNVLVARCESGTKNGLKRVKKDLEWALNSIGLKVPEF